MSEFIHILNASPKILWNAYKWRLKGTKNPIRSPPFSLQDIRNSEFFLQVQLRRQNSESSGYQDKCYFKMEIIADKDLRHSNVLLNFLVTVKYDAKNINKIFEKQVKCSEFTDTASVLLVNEISIFSARRYSCGNNISIFDGLVLDIEITQSIDCIQKPQVEYPLRPLLTYIEKLFVSKEFADIKIKVNEEIIEAHKLILVSRSPVFAAMFNSKMEKSLTNEIVINDITADCVREMLSYMYTGKLSKIENATLDLAEAADKYELLELKDFCEKYAKEKISVKNAIEIFEYGTLKNQDELCMVSAKFIIQNRKKFTIEKLKLIYNNAKFFEIFFSQVCK